MTTNYSSVPSVVPAKLCRFPVIVHMQLLGTYWATAAPVVAVYGIVPFAAIVPVFPPGAYRHYKGTTPPPPAKPPRYMLTQRKTL